MTNSTQFISEMDACVLSDLYKEANGHRPRWIDFSTMTVEEGQKMYNNLCEEIRFQIEGERSAKEHAYKTNIAKFLNYGAKDEAQAYKWWREAECGEGFNQAHEWFDEDYKEWAS